MAAETRKHNDSVYLKQVQTLKENGVPGKTTVPKVKYLMDKYPYIKKAKDIAEIIGVSVQSVHTARWKIRKDAENQQGEQKNDVPNTNVRLNEPNQTEVESHIDIWDQPYEPPYVPQEPTYTPQVAPAYIQPVIPPQTLAANQGAIFEIGTSGADGVTVKSLISVVYGKVADNRKYRVHIKIEEE